MIGSLLDAHIGEARLLVLEDIRSLGAHVGKSLGTSNPILIDQGAVDSFASVTGDDQWIHIDPGRAALESSFGGTLVHGYFLISLIPHLSRSIFRLRRDFTRINYGLNKVRFVSPVRTGSQICMSITVDSIVNNKDSHKVFFSNYMNAKEGGDLHMYAETIILYESRRLHVKDLPPRSPDSQPIDRAAP